MPTIATDLSVMEFDPFDKEASKTVFLSEKTKTSARYPEPNSEHELLALVELGTKIQNFVSLNRGEQNAILDCLEVYECFGQYVALIQWRIANRNQSANYLIEDFVCLLRALYHGLERFDDFVEAACEFVSKTSLSYLDFKIHVADGIIGEESWSEQAIVYRKVAEKMTSVKEKVKVLERLALIYEKKLFLENEVEPIYSKIALIDPFNVKARRFLKFVSMQAMKWKEAAEQLHAIVDGAQNIHERQRAAHELAQLYLYNLNDAAMAEELLKRHCKHSSLDITQTLVEAQERLGRFDELMNTLKDLEKLCREGAELAGVKYKQGTISLKAGKPKVAVEQLREAIVHNPQLLVAYESLIIALIEAKEPLSIVHTLEMLEREVNLPASKSALKILKEKAQSLQPLFSKTQLQKSA